MTALGAEGVSCFRSEARENMVYVVVFKSTAVYIMYIFRVKVLSSES